MKIAVSSTGKDLQSEIDPHLGRCAFFIVIETENMGFEVFDNENIALSGGAGIQAAKFLSSKNVGAVLTGSCGPNAMKTLSAAGIQVFTGLTGSVADAVEKYKQGILSPSTNAEVKEKSGLGQSEATESVMPRSRGGRGAGGRGRGMGRGGKGRGMGGGGKGV